MRACVFALAFLEADVRCILFRFTLTPQRMRMIVEAFKDILELGLEKPEQVVVSLLHVV
jgi:hypothetical protein